ncbi:hypothetical protein C9374_012829 [Naegleria lovaniensis]|uniref:Alpha-glucosidase n=1 Tax=Naegleria lovaniensis TaxID=51637 RepID=A0AA88G7H7_NAELO|nr:uncharacterized protein C9374_012829 [Naegleria lovaniensis]KAG2373097.1 hypothetical protein C9374_012829 [Naegleria lovaniensis]
MASTPLTVSLSHDASRVVIISSSVLDQQSQQQPTQPLVQVSLLALSDFMWRLEVNDPDESHLTLDSFAIEKEQELVSSALTLELVPSSACVQGDEEKVEHCKWYWDVRVKGGHGKTFIRIIDHQGTQPSSQENSNSSVFSLDLIENKEDDGSVLVKSLTFSHKFVTHSIPIQNKDANSKYSGDYTFENQSLYETLMAFSPLNKEKVYGFGEKSGHLSKDGRKWLMWNYDHFGYSFNSDPLYQSTPFLMFCGPATNSSSSLNPAIFVDTVSRQEWDLTLFKPETEEKIVKNSIERYGTMSMYLFVGETPLSLIQQFSHKNFTGRTWLPPMYALGFQQCRWSYYPEAKVREISDGFIQHDIPCDVFYLDIDYMNQFECFTISKQHFPKPAALANHLLLDNRQRFVAIIDPGISKSQTEPEQYKVYAEGTQEHVWCQLKGETYVEQVWPFRCCFPDYFNERVRKWWGKYYQDLMDRGIHAFWNDMNEPAVFNDGTFKTFTLAVDHNVSLRNGTTLNILHRFVHNAYGQLMARASHEGLVQVKPNERPFLLTRSGYSGVQKYAWSWSGDNNSTFDDMKLSIAMLLNMSLVGQVMVGADVGGFVGDCNPELYARWIALGALCYPFFRSHSTKDTLEQNAWAFGEECEKACRMFIKLRYRLAPYLYTYIQYATNSNKEYVPLIRPLWLEFPHDSDCYNSEFENTQLFVGPSLLVAPILEKGATSRKVYLPPHPGGFYDFFNPSRHFEGGQVVEFTEITWDKSIVLVKAGSIIPMRAESKQSIYDTLTSPIQYHVFGSENTNSAVISDSSQNLLYLDDGFSNEYRNGKFGLYKLVLRNNEKSETNNGTEQHVTAELIEGEGYPFVLTQEQVNAQYFKPFPEVHDLKEENSTNCDCL